MKTRTLSAMLFVAVASSAWAASNVPELLRPDNWKSGPGAAVESSKSGLVMRAKGSGARYAEMKQPVPIRASGSIKLRLAELDGVVVVQRYFFDTVGRFMNNDAKASEVRVTGTNAVTIPLVDAQTTPPPGQVVIKFWLEGSTPRAVLAHLEVDGARSAPVSKDQTNTSSLLSDSLWTASVGVKLGTNLAGQLVLDATGQGEQCAVMRTPVTATPASLCIIKCASVDGSLLVQRYFFDAAGSFLNNDGKATEVRIDSSEAVTIHLFDGETPPHVAKVALKLWLEGSSPRAVVSQLDIRDDSKTLGL